MSINAYKLTQDSKHIVYHFHRTEPTEIITSIAISTERFNFIREITPRPWLTELNEFTNSIITE